MGDGDKGGGDDDEDGGGVPAPAESIRPGPGPQSPQRLRHAAQAEGLTEAGATGGGYALTPGPQNGGAQILKYSFTIEPDSR